MTPALSLRSTVKDIPGETGVERGQNYTGVLPDLDNYFLCSLPSHDRCSCSHLRALGTVGVADMNQRCAVRKLVVVEAVEAVEEGR